MLETAPPFFYWGGKQGTESSNSTSPRDGTVGKQAGKRALGGMQWRLLGGDSSRDGWKRHLCHCEEGYGGTNPRLRQGGAGLKVWA